MQIFSFLHPELGIVFIKANSREEAQRAGQAALGSNLTFRQSGRTIEDARQATGARLYGVRNDGALITSGTAGVTNGQDNPNMVDFFTNLSSAKSSLNAVPPRNTLEPPTFPIEEDIERFEFGPAFERALRQGGVNIGAGGGLLGAQTRAAQQPLFSRFFGTEALRSGGDPVDPTIAEPSFQNFIAQNLQGGSLLGRQGAQQARDLLTQAQGFRQFGEEQLPTLLAGSFLNPATTEQGLNLANIAREAARTRFGSLSRFLPSAYDLSQSFLSQERPTRGTFADFLNERIFG